MLTFLSVFLGLVVGVQPVELTVGGDVVSVELQLDGHTVGVLRGEPWTLACDFGDALEPHELVAIGRDGDGREVARISQWLNLPQQRSQAELMLVDGANPPQARLLWYSADGSRPDRWRVTFDGEPLGIESLASLNLFELPAFDPQIPHLLQAELQFKRSLARVELIVGGPGVETVDTELTAFVVGLDQGKIPSASAMEGWFTKDGRPLEVVSVEHSASDILLVQEATVRLWGGLLTLQRQTLEPGRRNVLTQRLSRGLEKDDRLRVILPIAERTDDATLEQFHISKDFGIFEAKKATSTGATERIIADPEAQGLLAALPYPPQGPLRDDTPRRVADAVAIAAQAASAGRRARIVVLIAEPGTEDHSDHSVDTVRRYLSLLQVPLVVWSPNIQGRSKEVGAWGTAHNIATTQGLRQASLHLRQTLDKQLVVWLRGRHMPHQISMTAEAQRHLVPITSAVEPPADTDFFFAEPTVQTADAPVEPTSDSPSAESAGAPVEASPGVDASAVEAPQITDSALTGSAITGSANTDTPVTLTESVDVRLVNLDVVVRDTDGQPVLDLDRGDLELLVDGRPVPISHFRPPAPIEATDGIDPAVEDSSDEPAVTSADAPHLVVFFDGSALDQAGRKLLARALRQTFEAVSTSEVTPKVMLATYDRSVRIQAPSSPELSGLQAALSTIEDGGSLRPMGRNLRRDTSRNIARVAQTLAGAVTEDQRRLAAAERDTLLVELNAVAESLAAESRASYHALKQMVRALGGVEGRKILLYAGNGLALSPARALYDEVQESIPLPNADLARLRNEVSTSHLEKEIEALVDDASANGVTIYAVAPRTPGLHSTIEQGDVGRPGFQGRQASLDEEEIRSALCRLADGSGGLCQVGASEPQRLVQQTLDDARAAYSLAFEPPHAPDGSNHELEVRITRPDLTVQHRPSYIDKAPADRLYESLSAALFFGATSDALGMTVDAQVEGTNDSSAGPVTALDVRVPVGRLSLEPSDDATRLRANARLLVMSRNAEGTVSGVQEFPVTFDVGVEQLQRAPGLLYSHAVRLLLEPGEHTVAIGLWDTVGQLGSFTGRAVAVDGESP